MSREYQNCKLSYLKRHMPWCAAVVKSPCFQAALLQFLHSQNINIQIMELRQNKSYREYSNNSHNFCLDASVPSAKKKVRFNSEKSDDCRNVLDKCLEMKMKRSERNPAPKIVNVGTMAREEESDSNRKLNSGDSKSSWTQTQEDDHCYESALASQKSPNSKSQNSPECSNPTNADTDDPNGFPSRSSTVTPGNLLEQNPHVTELSETGYNYVDHNVASNDRNSKYSQSNDTRIENICRESTPNDPKSKPIDKPKFSPINVGNEPVTTELFTLHEPAEHQTSINMVQKSPERKNLEGGEKSEHSSMQKFIASCECVFSKMEDRGVNEFWKQFKKFLDEEKQMQKHINKRNATMMDEINSKLMYILQVTKEQAELSGAIIKAQSKKGKKMKDDMNLKQFHPTLTSSRRQSSAEDSDTKDDVNPRNVTQIAENNFESHPQEQGTTTSKDERVPDFVQKGFEVPGLQFDSKGFLSLKSDSECNSNGGSENSIMNAEIRMDEKNDENEARHSLDETTYMQLPTSTKYLKGVPSTNKTTKCTPKDSTKGMQIRQSKSKIATELTSKDPRVKEVTYKTTHREQVFDRQGTIEEALKSSTSICSKRIQPKKSSAESQIPVLQKKSANSSYAGADQSDEHNQVEPNKTGRRSTNGVWPHHSLKEQSSSSGSHKSDPYDEKLKKKRRTTIEIPISGNTKPRPVVYENKKGAYRKTQSPS